MIRTLWIECKVLLLRKIKLGRLLSKLIKLNHGFLRDISIAKLFFSIVLREEQKLILLGVVVILETVDFIIDIAIHLDDEPNIEIVSPNELYILLILSPRLWLFLIVLIH